MRLDQCYFHTHILHRGCVVPWGMFRILGVSEAHWRISWLMWGKVIGKNNWICMETLGVLSIPRCPHDIPGVLNTPWCTHDIPRCTHDIIRSTEHLRCTAHLLDYCADVMQGDSWMLRIMLVANVAEIFTYLSRVKIILTQNALQAFSKVTKE